MTASFVAHWVWPAGGSGGIWGDVVGSLLWVVIAAIVVTAIYKPARRAFEHWLASHIKEHTAELHRKLDHVILHHPDIPPLPEKPGAAVSQVADRNTT